jgi:hypothetical protein
MMKPCDDDSRGFAVGDGLRFERRDVVPDVSDVAKRVG